MNNYITKKKIDDKDVYFITFSDELRSTISDTLMFNRDDLVGIRDMCESMLSGEDNEKSLSSGDKYSYVNGGSGVYIISFRISDNYYKGYYFGFRNVKLLISSINSIIKG